ncbi:hypothetical protein ABDJ41_08015 [Pedobacter sp. ASV1-7]|uniref:hypothetical protein n=1 Tax=Pedobacter sp. ASV1-7 TaxID=3145237 RepID=UPI0032E9175A
MTQRSITYFFISILFIPGCKSKQIVFPPKVISAYDYTKFCDLPNHLNQSVYTRGIYRSVEEYWGLISENRDCEGLESYVEWPQRPSLKPKFRKLLRQVHLKYWKYYLIADVVGKFEMEDTLGYGHLNSYKTKFTVEKLVNIQRMNKKKTKN